MIESSSYEYILDQHMAIKSIFYIDDLLHVAGHKLEVMTHSSKATKKEQSKTSNLWIILNSYSALSIKHIGLYCKN